MMSDRLEGKPDRDIPKPYPNPAGTYTAQEIVMPAAFPDESELRDRLKHYCNSVHRMDQSIGRILDALEETGNIEQTLVLFVSDHGLGWPFAKWALYPSGIRTSLTFRCPSLLPPGKRIMATLMKNIMKSVTFSMDY